MNSVVHFEMPYDNPERVAKFYHTAFGWETQQTGEEMGNYVLATTTETDSERRPTHPGAINGGFFRKQADRPAQVPAIVISVDNMKEARDRVTRAGGRVLGEPMEIPGVGMYVSFMDPEGNRVGMLEPSRKSRDHAQARVSSAGDSKEHNWSPGRPSESKEHTKR